MALQKQPANINFSQGVDTKTDPYQVDFGKFLTLTNMVFDTAKRLSKRNGFANITTLPNFLQTTLTTLNDNLIATGSNLYAFSSDTDQWLNQGLVQPVDLEVQAMVRVSTSQTSPDSATYSNGLTCVTYTDNSVAYYHVVDSNTGQQIVSRTSLGANSSESRVFLLGRFFVLVFKQTVLGTPHLRYIAVPIATPGTPNTVQDISTTLPSNAGFDCYSANNSLYIAYGDSGTTVKVTQLTSLLVLAAPTVLSSSTAMLMSVTVDENNLTPVIWVTFWDSGTTNGWTAAFNSSLAPVLAKTQIITTKVLTEITSVAYNSLLTVLFEISNTYAAPYPTSNVRTDFIDKVTCTQAGSVGSTSTILRSVGLASKAFIASSGTIYTLVAYGETNQPTYFLIDSLGNVIMRLAYSNGGGYKPTQVLSNVTEVDSTFYVSYLIKDFLATVNKNTNNPSGTPVNAIYTQTGINLAKFGINNSGQYSSEIANTLHLTGGQLWMYDTVKPVEHGFQVWPENVAAQGSQTAGSATAQLYYYAFTYEWTDNQGNLHRSAPSIPLAYTILTPPATFTGNRTSGSAIISAISSTANLQAGQAISGTGIPASTFILSVDSATQITMTANATSGTATSTTITPVVVSAVSLYVPTLRLTYKVSPNPVRIVGYRWSTAQQVYYQFTSLTAPTTNDTSVDYVTITDTHSDAQILGQTLLYTTGGVVENIAAPASIDSALFKNRVFLIDAEDPNLLWYSKQVIEGTPVEMSDLFTLFIAPTSGAQGSTGAMTAITAMDDKLIIFKKDAIYYLTGIGPDNTGANNDFTDPIFITSSVGCSNPNSIVLMPNGVMFQSDKGIWLLGRDLSTTYIGSAVEAFNSQTVLAAASIPATNQVRFVLDNSITLVYDYYFQQWGTFTNIRAITATLFQSQQTYLNEFGQVFQETPGTYTDGSVPVLMGFTTGWINLAGLQGYERFYFFYLLGSYFSPFKLNVQLAYDYNENATQNIVVSPDNYSPPYGGDAVWGASGPWGGPGKVFSARVFPATQKCDAFQIKIDEVYDATLTPNNAKGMTLSGLNMVVGVKKGYRVQKASQSFG
jgi:hypothetical protein